MSKRKRRARANAITTAPAPRGGNTAITSSRPPAAVAPPSAWSSLTGRLVLFAVVAVGVLAVWFFYRDGKGDGSSADLDKWARLRMHGPWSRDRGSGDRQRQPQEGKQLTVDELWRKVLSGKLGKRDNWKPEPWKPVKPDDQTIDRFVKLHQKGDPAAHKMLAALPAGDRALSEAEAERVATDHFLRHSSLRIVDIWKGDPGPDGKPRPAPGRYILVTEGTVSSPVLRVKDASGRESPSQINLSNPDLVVEVARDGIRGIRSEMHKAP
jgi:hypothetical protein